MSQGSSKNSEIYSKITDTIFAVIMGLSFKEYYWLLAPPVISFKFAVMILGYLVVIVSRVGYHKSISLTPYKGSKRFLVDLWILYMYVVLTFAPGGLGSSPNVATVLFALVAIFYGYLVWDLFKKAEYPASSTFRIIITAICFFLAVMILVFFHLPIGNTGVYLEKYTEGTLRDWLFLLSEYAVVMIFWSLKSRRFQAIGGSFLKSVTSLKECFKPLFIK